jgi:hypothetical protein
MSRSKSLPATASRKGRKAKAPTVPPAASAPVDLDAKRAQRKAQDAATTAGVRKGRKGRRSSNVPALEAPNAESAAALDAQRKASEAERTLDALDRAIISGEADKAAAQVEVGPAEQLELLASDLLPFLAIAPTKEKRHYMNSIYVHKIGDELRLVATDGHRLLVQSIEHKTALPWAEKGLLLPTERLAQIYKYLGKSEEPITIAYGSHWPKGTVQAFGAVFEIQPIDATYPDYTRILADVGNVFASEREPTETSAINPKYLKAAGAVGSMFKAEGVFCYTGETDKSPMAFTFTKAPGVILVVMPVASDKVGGIEKGVARLIGEKGMAGTLAALRAHETRQRKAGNDDAANKFAARIAEILAGVSPQLEHKKEEAKA